MKPEQRTRQEKIDIQLGRAGWLIGIRRLIRSGWAGQDVDFGRFLRIPEWVNPARILSQPAAEWESPGAGTSESRILARLVQETPSLAEAWPSGVFVQPAVAQMGGNPIVQAALAQLPSYHHTILLNKLKTAEDRLWYAGEAVECSQSDDARILPSSSLFTDVPHLP